MGRPARMLTARGRTQRLSEWCREIGVSREAVAQRLTAGWPVDEALFTPVGARTRWHREMARLSDEDRKLIRACKAERDRLRAEQQRLATAIVEYSDERLARKFETSKTVIANL